MLLLAFIVSASVAFGADLKNGQKITAPQVSDVPCLRCQWCGDLFVCVIASDCDAAMSALDKELGKHGCGKKNSEEKLSEL